MVQAAWSFACSSVMYDLTCIARTCSSWLTPCASSQLNALASRRSYVSTVRRVKHRDADPGSLKRVQTRIDKQGLRPLRVRQGAGPCGCNGSCLAGNCNAAGIQCQTVQRKMCRAGDSASRHGSLELRPGF